MTGRPVARCCRTPSTSWAGSPARRRLGILNRVGWVGPAALAAGWLRALAAGGGVGGGPRDGPRPPASARGAAAGRALEALPLAAVALAIWHGWLALRSSPFVVLFAMPAYLAAALLLVTSRRRRRGAAGGAPRGGGGGEGPAGGARRRGGGGAPPPPPPPPPPSPPAPPS